MFCFSQMYRLDSPNRLAFYRYVEDNDRAQGECVSRAKIREFVGDKNIR